MLPLLIQVEDESRTWGIVRGMAHHTYGGWTSPRLLGASARRVEILSIWGGDTLHTEMNFAGWFIKTRMGLITNGGTFSKCGLPPTQYYIQSFFSSMYISLYKFSRSLIQQCNISQFLIYYLLVKMNFFFYIVKDLVNLGLLVAKLYLQINWIMISVVYF